MAPNELLKPLGVKTPKPPRRIPWHLIAAGTIVVLAIVGLFVVVLSDHPLEGGTAVVSLPPQTPTAPAARPGAAATPPAPMAPAAPAAGTTPGTPRVGAPAAPGASGPGLTEMKPDGGLSDAPSGDVIIRDPASAAPVALTPVPREELLEPTRYGLVPRVAPDGTRPLDLYARPVGTVPVAAGARIAIVVGGLGLSDEATDKAIRALPGEVGLAFAPYGKDLGRWVGRARQDGHEVLLQIPLEPFDYPRIDPGPRTLTVAAKGTKNIDDLLWHMSRFTTYVGVMSFMGARFTADDEALGPVIAEIGKRGLLFLDDGSSSRSRATIVAPGKAPYAAADLVIDADTTPQKIDAALGRLEALAKARGSAIGTASAFPETVDRIAAWAKNAASRGFVLVPVTSLAKAG